MCQASISQKKNQKAVNFRDKNQGNQEFLKKDSQEGATIVEVAVIVPMILIVVMGCIFLLFFILDMGAVQSESIYIANEVATQWRETEHKSVGEEESSLKKRLKKKLILTKFQSGSVHVSVGKVTVKTTVGFQLAGRQLSFTSDAKASIDNREQWIRILLHPDS